MTSRVETNPIGGSGKLWAFVPVLILGAMFVGWGVMLSYALDDPSFGVEPNYYQKAVQFDAYQAQERQNQRLGFQLQASLEAVAKGTTRLRVHATDASHQPLTGASVAVSAFHLARSSKLWEADLEAAEPGTFTADLPVDRPGLWELRFRVERAGDTYTQTTRVELGGGQK